LRVALFCRVGGGNAEWGIAVMTTLSGGSLVLTLFLMPQGAISLIRGVKSSKITIVRGVHERLESGVGSDGGIIAAA